MRRQLVWPLSCVNDFADMPPIFSDKKHERDSDRPSWTLYRGGNALLMRVWRGRRNPQLPTWWAKRKLSNHHGEKKEKLLAASVSPGDKRRTRKTTRVRRSDGTEPSVESRIQLPTILHCGEAIGWPITRPTSPQIDDSSPRFHASGSPRLLE